jgi:hypothetical protein
MPSAVCGCPASVDAQRRLWLTEIMIYDPAEQSPGALLAIAAVFIISLIFAVAGYLVVSWFLMRIFRKAGVEGWKAWVPFYNSWIFLELGGQQGWLILLHLVPGGGIVATIFGYIASYHVGASFSKPGAGWVVLYIFLPFIWLAIVAFDNSRWNPALMTVRPIYGSNVPWPAGPDAPSPS